MKKTFLSALLILMILAPLSCQKSSSSASSENTMTTDSIKASTNEQAALRFDFAFPDVTVYRGESKLAAFVLPEGSGDPDESENHFSYPYGTQAGTNLISKELQFYIDPFSCDTKTDGSMSWSKVNINGITFDKGESGDAGAGQQYISQHYQLSGSGYCLHFVLKLHASIALEPGAKEFDQKIEDQFVADFLKTIVLK